MRSRRTCRTREKERPRRCSTKEPHGNRRHAPSGEVLRDQAPGGREQRQETLTEKRDLRHYQARTSPLSITTVSQESTKTNAVVVVNSGPATALPGITKTGAKPSPLKFPLQQRWSRPRQNMRYRTGFLGIVLTAAARSSAPGLLPIAAQYTPGGG